MNSQISSKTMIVTKSTVSRSIYNGVVICVIFLFHSTNCFCQLSDNILIPRYDSTFTKRYVKPKNNGVGVSLMIQSSANGYGIEYLPGIYLKRGKKTFVLSSMISNRFFNLSGFQFNYEYSVTGKEIRPEDKNLELHFFTSLAYHHCATLLESNLQIENPANSTNIQKSISEIHVKSAEIYGGFGLKIKLLKFLKWNSCIGFGGYTTFDYSYKDKSGNNGQAIGLLLKTGITLNIK